MLRRFAMGDPQVPLQRLLEVLDAQGLLRGDRLAEDVRLLSLGDHFDFRPDGLSPAEAAAEGLAVLRWLSEHPPEQLRILLGNHDVVRVMELHAETDLGFARAHALAREIRATRDPERRAALTERFHRRHPGWPTPGTADRDFSAFSEAQRALLQELLLAGRVQLAATDRLPEGPGVLATHALVTGRELGLLGLPEAEGPEAVAEALNARLHEAVAAAAPAWRAGEAAPLDLAPLHLPGIPGAEGGGLLYHRPSNPGRPGADAGWEGARRRRFDPRTLPTGLVQICGHTQHEKALKELQGFDTEAAAPLPPNSLRWLEAEGGQVRYRPYGGRVPQGGAAVMVDAAMNARGVLAHAVPLLPLAG
ncbi:MAG: transcriptional regulator [Alphaproteobacteria bacterium]|nr:transcriptional regulator [Alphaproteobacteria bacterium]